MILALVDDLMFVSKIRHAAAQLGITLAVASGREAALAQMRRDQPSLVIFDLNNRRTDPLGTMAAMKMEPALASIQTLGYVSHVDRDLIDKARAAGVGEVMPRSVFSQRLGEILTGKQ
jgi:PleD family two-component response regulator